jgi:hypothetical protein
MGGGRRFDTTTAKNAVARTANDEQLMAGHRIDTNAKRD